MKKTFVLAAQSFHKNYVFNYNGGQVYCYDIEVAIEGDKATSPTSSTSPHSPQSGR